jgi:hypothetical protein
LCHGPSNVVTHPVVLIDNSSVYIQVTERQLYHNHYSDSVLVLYSMIPECAGNIGVNLHYYIVSKHRRLHSESFRESSIQQQKWKMTAEM